MQTTIALYLALVFAWLSNINAITVSPGKVITEGNCSGPLDYFLCNCTVLNATIDIHLLPGHYHFIHKRSCLLQNKTGIKLTGNSSDDTIIECKKPFNIVFMETKGIIISKITMVSCGNVVDALTNQTIYNTTNNDSHFGSGFRYAIMLNQVKDVTITEFTMQSTFGYGIVAFNAIGSITITKFKVENTTFEKDPKCNANNSYNNDNHQNDFSCSGSGIFMIYHDNEIETNTTLVIDQSNFIANRNFLPHKQFSILVDAINMGLYKTSIPLQGAASITIFYLQNSYNVNTIITNSLFHNNNGTLSATIAIESFSTTRGKTFIQNCLFDDNNRINRSSAISPDNDYYRGGISYYYLSLLNRARTYTFTDLSMVEILTVIHSDFTKLGGRLGAAFHIEKISVNTTTSLFIRIENCSFSENEANAGSAVYAVDSSASLSNGLTISLVDVNANNNALSPSSTVEYVSRDLITGIFHSETCHFKFDCNVQCSFLNNQPSVFYGHSAYLTISGKAIFVNNTARYGGGLSLINTVAFIHQDSELYFGKNHATVYGGAIDVFFFNTNIRAQDKCPVQFIGSSNATPIFSLKEIEQIRVNITFKNNTAGPISELQSIFANVFYVCKWYPYTLTQINLGENAPIINGTRQSVYQEIFKFIPANAANEHLSVLAYLPCPCDENNTFDAEQCLTADLNNTLQLGTSVIVGRSFTISLITLDVVGAIGHSSVLYSEVSSLNTTINVLTLPKEQHGRSFTVVNRACTPIDFTIYSLQSTIPATGMLHLSLSRNSDHHLHFSFDECPAGFSLQNIDGLYACTCSELFNKSPIKEDFQCNSISGKIKRIDIQSHEWLSVINDIVEYTQLCLPEYCNNIVSEFSPTDIDVLCNPHHTGRACGACDDGFGKIFGSRFCRKCSNVWLVTILLYGILGIILVLIIHLLKLTVTVGTINGLIFFCNIMSINENLFFSPSKFSFVRLFVSSINLDLGFEMCFYREMSEIAKTGLQFVFPLYLWLLMFIIIMVGKRYIRVRKSTHSAVPVLATLILLSYSKLLRATISVFSFVTVHYSTRESDFSNTQKFVAWQPEPNIPYFEGLHIFLFLVAMAFMVFFTFPLSFSLIFPTIVLRSKKMSYFFPLLDCIYAPYKNQYRYWFGARTIVLIYFSGIESIILFSHQQSLLLSGVVIVLLFVFIQVYIHPFKSKINNILDLIFMGIFIALSVIVLYVYPSTSSHKENIAVNVLGGVAFLLFCLIIIIHLHDALMHFTRYSEFIEPLKAKFKGMQIMQKNWNPLYSVNASDVSSNQDSGNINDSYAYLQESLLEEQFN